MICPHTSEQNELVETKHRHIVDIGITLMSQATLSLKFWAKIICNICILDKQVTHQGPEVQKSIYEMLHETKSVYHSLRTFGCLCFPYTGPYNTHKLSFRTTPCTFLGYTSKQKGYKCMENKGRVFVSRHVVFNEHVFPLVEKENMTSSKACNPTTTLQLLPELIKQHIEEKDNESQHERTDATHAFSSKDPTEDIPDTHNNDNTSETNNDDNNDTTNEEEQGQMKTQYKNVHRMVTRGKSGIFKPKIYIISASDREPSCYKEATTSKEWKSSVDEEYNA